MSIAATSAEVVVLPFEDLSKIYDFLNGQLSRPLNWEEQNSLRDLIRDSVEHKDSRMLNRFLAEWGVRIVVSMPIEQV